MTQLALHYIDGGSKAEDNTTILVLVALFVFYQCFAVTVNECYRSRRVVDAASQRITKCGVIRVEGLLWTSRMLSPKGEDEGKAADP